MTTSRASNYHGDWSDYHFACLCQIRSVTRPPPPNSNAHMQSHAYTHTHTQMHKTPRDAECIMKKTRQDTSICSRSLLLSLLLADAYTHTHTHTHTHSQTHTHMHKHRGNPSPSFRPPQQPWHAVERGRRPHLENRRGLLLCLDGGLTPKFSQNSTSLLFSSTLSHIIVRCLGGFCCKQSWRVLCYIERHNILAAAPVLIRLVMHDIFVLFFQHFLHLWH